MGAGQGPLSLNELHFPRCVAWGKPSTSLGLDFLTCETGKIRKLLPEALGGLGGIRSLLQARGTGASSRELWYVRIGRATREWTPWDGSGSAHVQTWQVSTATACRRTPAPCQGCARRGADGTKGTGRRDDGGASHVGRGGWGGCVQAAASEGHPGVREGRREVASRGSPSCRAGAWGGQAGHGEGTSGGQQGREDQQQGWFWGDGGRVLTPGDIRAEGAPQPIHRLDAGLEISLGEEWEEGAGCHGGAASTPQAVAPGQGSDGTPTVPGPRRSDC